MLFLIPRNRSNNGYFCWSLAYVSKAQYMFKRMLIKDMHELIKRFIVDDSQILTTHIWLCHSTYQDIFRIYFFHIVFYINDIRPPVLPLLVCFP